RVRRARHGRPARRDRRTGGAARDRVPRRHRPVRFPTRTRGYHRGWLQAAPWPGHAPGWRVAGLVVAGRSTGGVCVRRGTRVLSLLALGRRTAARAPPGRGGAAAHRPAGGCLMIASERSGGAGGAPGRWERAGAGQAGGVLRVRRFPELTVATPRLHLRAVVADDAPDIGRIFADRQTQRWLSLPAD